MREVNVTAASEIETRTFRAEPVGITAVDAWLEDIGRRWSIDERASFQSARLHCRDRGKRAGTRS